MARAGPHRAHPDAETLAGLYEQYYDRVARYIAARTGSRDIAEDLAGDVFVRVVESIGSYRERGVPLHAWLFRIAHNRVIDYYRRHASRRAVPLDSVMELADASDPPTEVERRLSMEQVGLMMQRLNSAQQEVIALRFMGGLSAGEAGAVMGRTAGAIRELQRTALKALRASLGPEITHLRAAPQQKGGGP